MSGREKFKENKIFINICVKFVGVFPKSIRIFTWDAISIYSQIPFIAIRYIILKSMIKECGDNIRIGKNVTIIGWKNIILGKKCKHS